MGTAFFIAPGVAVTAAHCVDAMAQAHGDFREGEEGPTADWVVTALQYLPTENRVWQVDKLMTNAHTDVAVLRLRGNPDWHDTVHPHLTFRPPRVGERMVGFGFAGKAEVAPDDVVQVDPQGHTSVGEVTEVFPSGRDRLLAPFPCFHVNCRFDDSQSGGPVFAEDGAICGVVSRSLPAHDEDDQHTSVVSMIYPISWLAPNVPWDEWRSDQPFLLFDYFKATKQVRELDRLTRIGDDFLFDSSPRDKV